MLQALAVEKWLEQSLRPHAAGRPATAPRLEDISSSMHHTAKSQSGVGQHYEVSASPRQLLLKELREIEQVHMLASPGRLT